MCSISFKNAFICLLSVLFYVEMVQLKNCDKNCVDYFPELFLVCFESPNFCVFAPFQTGTAQGCALLLAFSLWV